MNNLAITPKLDRFASKPSGSPVRIDRVGGVYSAGVISGVSLCSRGEALGHGMWCDAEFIDQVIAAGKSNSKRLKCRFTHPDMCSDGMGKALGTIDLKSRVGDQAIGDLHFYRTAHNAPDGDLAEYVMNLAEEDPENFGLSIVFEHDFEAEEEFEAANTREVELKDESGVVREIDVMFVSPDTDNTKNLPHARLLSLNACDVVDEPAANPSGLFHRENEIAQSAIQMIDFVIGKTDIAPEFSALGKNISPERAKLFIQNQLAKHGLTLTTKEQEMSIKLNSENLSEKEEEKKTDGDEMPEEKKTEEEPEMNADDKPDSDSCSNPVEEKPEKCSSDLSKFCEAFGHEAGARYLLDGLSFEAAQTKHIAELSSKLKEADEKLKALSQSGVDPVPFSAVPEKKKPESHDKSLDNRVAFAAANGASLN